MGQLTVFEDLSGWSIVLIIGVTAFVMIVIVLAVMVVIGARAQHRMHQAIDEDFKRRSGAQ